MVDLNINSCICCGKKITKNENIRNIMCIDCMAKIIKDINIEPDDDYSDFIDFAYDIKKRLEKGEDARKIMKNTPEGFEVWLKKNSSLSGYGLISE
jgi:hypothetical protein